MHDSKVRVDVHGFVLCSGSAPAKLEMEWVFWDLSFNGLLLSASCYRAQYGSACGLYGACMNRAIKKSATDFAFCGGFFECGHILLGSAVAISGKNHKIASASTIKQK